MVSRLGDLRAEATLIPEETMYCPNQGCAQPVVVPAKHDVVHDRARQECPICKTKLCIRCRTLWHEGKTCAQAQAKPSEEMRKLSRVVGYGKQCPSCQHFVQRTGGCNHMTCLCRQEFCYRCGRPWYEKNSETRVCQCLLFEQVDDDLASISNVSEESDYARLHERGMGGTFKTKRPQRRSTRQRRGKGESFETARSSHTVTQAAVSQSSAHKVRQTS